MNSTLEEIGIRLMTDCNRTGSSWVFGDLTPSLYCYPITPPVPLGAGTLCQTPTGQVSGSFSMVTVDALRVERGR